jgi:hypothetical protein
VRQWCRKRREHKMTPIIEVTTPSGRRILILTAWIESIEPLDDRRSEFPRGNTLIVCSNTRHVVIESFDLLKSMVHSA